jgi:hypothetical protein
MPNIYELFPSLWTNGTRSIKSKGKDEEFEYSFLNKAQNHSNWKIHKLLQPFNFGTIMREIYVI